MGNNVLWAGYRTDCYVGLVSGELITFDVTTSNNYGCYFGKLKPNTTYTIKRLDTSSRMRIGVANTDYSTVYASVNPANYTHTQIIDSNDPHTFATNENTQYIAVYFTNTGETNIRVMLNEGSTALPYEEPTEPMPGMFVITDGINNNYPYLSGVPIPSDTVFTEPYPTWIWRIDPTYNDGYPYLIGLRPVEPTPTPVEQHDYISVYDSRETDFTHNGERILSPISCEISEELNAGYELTLVHPIDDTNNWLYLNEFNIIKAQGQLFRIYKRVKSMSNDTVTVNARHIWYDLASNYLDDVRPTNLNGDDALNWILSNTYETHNFTGTSDIETLNTAYYQSMSPVKAFLGADNAFINRWGGELYRDNFTFTINKRRGHDNAFNIRYGVDMTEVEETVDLSEFCSRLIATDNFGHKVTIHAHYYVGVPVAVQAVVFNYDTDDYDAFTADAQEYIQARCYPQINYTVKFANFKNLPEYAGFTGLQECNLGDEGIIYNERLGIGTTQKVIKRTVDAITGEVLSIELGTAKNSITRPKQFTNALSPQDPMAESMERTQKQLQDTIAKTSKTWNNTSYSWNRLNRVAWNDFY